MIFCFGHVIQNLNAITEVKCLLRFPSKYWLLVKYDSLEGYYILFGGDTGNWIWAGKAIGRDVSTPRTGLLNYKKGHQAALSKSGALDNNKFYHSYPT